MSEPTTATVRFFYSPTGVGPGFVIPVFEADGFYILKGTPDGLIEGFETWDRTTTLELDHLSLGRTPAAMAPTLFRSIAWLPVLAAANGVRPFPWLPVLSPGQDNGRIVPRFPYLFFVIPLGVIGYENFLACSVGEPVRLGFATNTVVFFGERDALQAELRNGRGHGFWKDAPFSEVEVADFIGDRDQYEDAVTRSAALLASEDGEIARRWQAFMLNTDLVGRETEVEKSRVKKTE